MIHQVDDPRFAAMAAFYDRVDAEVAGLDLSCSRCGDCCRFDRAEHILYTSRLERLYLAAVSPVPDLPPELGLAEALARGHRCPYHTVEGLCLARRGRVLGCRVHHCSVGDPGAFEELSARLHQELGVLHEEFGEEWEYRPLLPL